MKEFTINGNKYNSVPFTFNLMCDLEDMGTPIETADSRPTSVLRSYFALCGNMGKDAAGKEIEEHLIKGGTLNELSDAFGKELDESGFFRALGETEEKETSTGAEQEKKTKA